MATLNTQRISRRTVEALPVGEREVLYWDSELSGFGIRVYPSGSKVYLVQTRKGGKSRRLTVGRHGLISADRARNEAARIIADIKAGREPLPANGAAPLEIGPTVAEVAARYMREHVEVRCKPTTIRQCRHTLDHHLLPALGAEPLGAIGRERVAALHYSLHETPVMANKVVDMLSRLFYMAEGWGIAPEGGNPCKFVRKYKERSCERFPLRRGVPTSRPRSGRSRSRRQGVRERGGGVSPADTHRLPAQRDSDAALGRCGPRCGRDSASRREDRCALRRALDGGEARACRDTAPAGQSLGDRRGEARRPPEQPQQRLARGAGPGGPEGRSHS